MHVNQVEIIAASLVREYLSRKVRINGIAHQLPVLSPTNLTTTNLFCCLRLRLRTPVSARGLSETNVALTCSVLGLTNRFFWGNFNNFDNL